MAIGSLRSLHKAVASAGTAEPLIAVKTMVVWARINPQLLTGVVNTGDVVIGDSGVSLTNSPNILAADPAFDIIAPDNAPFDLSEIYVDSATNDDGVGVWYLLG